MTQIRLVHINGPLQALAATAVVRHLQEREPMENVMAFDTGFVHRSAGLRQSSIECASAAGFSRMIDLGSGDDLTPLGELRRPGVEVADLVLQHNYSLGKRLIE